MGDAEFGVSLDQGLIQHLLLFIGHIRNQEREENHQLLDLPGQHGVDVTVIHLIDQLHLRRQSGTDLHDIDTGAGAGRQLDIGASNLVAGTLELMTLERRQDKALDAAHP